MACTWNAGGVARRPMRPQSGCPAIRTERVESALAAARTASEAAPCWCLEVAIVTCGMGSPSAVDIWGELSGVDLLTFSLRRLEAVVRSRSLDSDRAH